MIVRATENGNSIGPDKLVNYRLCPDCNVAMVRFNFGRSSDVVLDMCREHGTWFDVGELQKTLIFINNGGLERRDMNRVEYIDSHVRPVANDRLTEKYWKTDQERSNEGNNSNKASFLEMIQGFFR